MFSRSRRRCSVRLRHARSPEPLGSGAGVPMLGPAGKAGLALGLLALAYFVLSSHSRFFERRGPSRAAR